MRSYLLPGLLLIVDVITIIGVALISLLIRFDGYISSHYLYQMIDALPIMVISYIVMLLSMHLYTRIWRYAGMREMVAVLIATTLGAGLFYTGMYVFDKSLPRSIYLISWIPVLSELVEWYSIILPCDMVENKVLMLIW